LVGDFIGHIGLDNLKIVVVKGVIGRLDEFVHLVILKDTHHIIGNVFGIEAVIELFSEVVSGDDIILIEHIAEVVVFDSRGGFGLDIQVINDGGLEFGVVIIKEVATLEAIDLLLQ